MGGSIGSFLYGFMPLNSARHFSKAYFHGHCVGGTNPSLLEAMASECFVLAHDNIFNRAVLKEIKNEYSWEHLVDQHEEYFKWLLEQKKV